MNRIVLLLCALIALGSNLNAQSVKELETQRKNTLKQLETTSKLLQETQKGEKASLNKLTILKRNIASRQTLINDINKEISAINADIDSINLLHSELQTELADLHLQYAKLVRETHYARTQNNTLLFLLSADNFQQLTRRIQYLQQFTAYKKQQAKQIQTLQARLQQQNEELQQYRRNKQDILNLQKREADKLTSDQKREQLMLAELKKKEKNLRAQQKKQQQKADELNNRITKLIEADIQKSKSKSGKQQQKIDPKTNLTKEEALIAGSFEKNKGRLPWPTERGFISGNFGIQQHPVLQHVTINNKGIYIQTPANTDARAVFEGEVTQCFSVSGSNYAVIIKHGNYRTMYANLTKLYVKEGDHVKAKQNIGRIYSDPDNDNKTELYFQVWKDISIENPSLWLAR